MPEKILIVDDDLETLRLVGIMLQRQGYAIVAAFYLFAGLITWFSREKLLRIPIMNSIIARLFRENSTQYEKN